MSTNNTVIPILVIPYNHAFPPVKLNTYSESRGPLKTKEQDPITKEKEITEYKLIDIAGYSSLEFSRSFQFD